MKLYAEVEIRIVEKNSFKGNDGNTVDYYTIFVKDNEAKVLELTSGKDFTEYEGSKGVAAIEAREREGGGFKLSLRDFKEGESIGEEEEID